MWSASPSPTMNSLNMSTQNTLCSRTRNITCEDNSEQALTSNCQLRHPTVLKTVLDERLEGKSESYCEPCSYTQPSLHQYMTQTRRLQWKAKQQQTLFITTKLSLTVDDHPKWPSNILNVQWLQYVNLSSDRATQLSTLQMPWTG